MKKNILEELILVGGPPRSGTTFAARALNFHPQIMTAVDDLVYESWILYHYQTRGGLVQDLRIDDGDSLTRDLALSRIRDHLIAGDMLRSVVPSDKTTGQPVFIDDYKSDPSSRITATDIRADRLSFPLRELAPDWHLCLKSPEISFVMPQLAKLIPDVRFMLVYRPVIEIAESMFRKGCQVTDFPVFHRRWQNEKIATGLYQPPPGIPAEWFEIWQTATPFQRCVLYAASYIRAMAEGISQLKDQQYFLYNHESMRDNPAECFAEIARFLSLDVSGFSQAQKAVKNDSPLIQPGLWLEFLEISRLIDIESLEAGLAGFKNI